MRHAVLYQDENGDWVAEVPSLPGCVSGGSTKSEALANIAEAAELLEEVMRENGDVVPQEVTAPEVMLLE